MGSMLHISAVMEGTFEGSIKISRYLTLVNISGKLYLIKNVRGLYRDLDQLEEVRKMNFNIIFISDTVVWQCASD